MGTPQIQDTWWASGIHLYSLFLPKPMTATSSVQRPSLVLQLISRFLSSQQSVQTASPTTITTGSTKGTLLSPANYLWRGTRRIEGWQLIHVSLPILDAQQQTQRSKVGSQELPALFSQMKSYACTHRDSANSTVGYLILHIEEIGFSHENHKKPERNKINQSMSDPRTDLRNLFDRFDTPHPGEPRGYFRHYDSVKKRRGYLIVGRNATLLADLSDESLSSLLPLLQGSPLTSQGGFTFEGFSAALTRVAQWDANQDIRESIDNLAEIKKNSDASTYGQIWLSYALALIGITLSLIAFVLHPTYLAPGLIILALSGIMHARFAQKGTANWQLIGQIIFWLGVIVTVIGFLLGIQQQFPSLPSLKIP
jgi:hypothetical protein